LLGVTSIVRALNLAYPVFTHTPNM
jgi:hypothetical protein